MNVIIMLFLLEFIWQFTHTIPNKPCWPVKSLFRGELHSWANAHILGMCFLCSAQNEMPSRSSHHRVSSPCLSSLVHITVSGLLLKCPKVKWMMRCKKLHHCLNGHIFKTKWLKILAWMWLWTLKLSLNLGILTGGQMTWTRSIL